VPVADVNGTALYYERGGTGEPLLLIMGMGGSHLHWGEPFATTLRRDFDTIAYDHRGIGNSGALAGELAISQLADDAADLLAALEVESAHVLGVSMGGMVAQQLALRHPARVRTLTLGATYAGGPGSRLTDRDVVEALTQASLSGDVERAIAASWQFNFTPAYCADDDNFGPYLDVCARMRPPLAVLMAQAGAIGSHDVSARLSEIDAPTLVIHGTEDRMLHASNGELIAATIPGARLELLDGVGHMFWWEQPQRSAALVAQHAGAGERPRATAGQ
jgi:pimeloyl-ACP methyl ester carboxylesterase